MKKIECQNCKNQTFIEVCETTEIKNRVLGIEANGDLVYDSHFDGICLDVVVIKYRCEKCDAQVMSQDMQ